VARGSSPEAAASVFLVCIGSGLLMAWLLGVLLRVHELRWRPLLAGLGFVAAGVIVYVLGIGPTLLTLTIGWWPLLLIAIGAILLAGARARAGDVHDVDDETARVPMAHAPLDHGGGDAQRSDRGGYAQTPDWAHDQPPPLDPEQQHHAVADDTETSWDSEALH
jgi:hypothetical protein